MKQFITTKFFRTLQEASQSGVDADANQLQNEYDDFAEIVFAEGISTKDRAAFCNALNYTRTEFSGLRCLSPHRGKKS